MLSVQLFALFWAGLLGGGHCVAMCGGLTTAFTLSMPKNKQGYYLIGLNAGRLLSYITVGFVMGVIGMGVHYSQIFFIQRMLQYAASGILLLLGLYTLGFSNKIVLLEKIGMPVWRRVKPVLQSHLPLRSWWQTIPVGFLWGALPCGLVYTAAISALFSASYWQGMLCMLAFGLGTLPNLLLMGMFAIRLRCFWQYRWARKLSGLAIILLACYPFLSK